jgi:hypothetical protein
VCLLLWLVLIGSATAGHASDRRVRRLQATVDELRAKLQIAAPVVVSIVRENTRLVSVDSVPGRHDAFRLVCDEDFLDALEDDELVAVFAHELGHVWIFTHHPYLHTEALANEIAMRVVSGDSLTRVYRKVSQRRDDHGDLTRVLDLDR